MQLDRNASLHWINFVRSLCTTLLLNLFDAYTRLFARTQPPPKNPWTLCCKYPFLAYLCAVRFVIWNILFRLASDVYVFALLVVSEGWFRKDSNHVSSPSWSGGAGTTSIIQNANFAMISKRFVVNRTISFDSTDCPCENCCKYPGPPFLTMHACL